ncbi:MAG: UDP-N-acetylmuramoyl-tripeptide--D-alanyl-D-alanine ligase [Gemmatimonadales bacterium]|nr:MAG: UDP-N-acetylmuramoyl-tripeptide--D-alanyl-D-alanine ligase [Gemmatimonadales bacterium]
MIWTAERVARALGIEVSGNAEFSAIGTDTRTLVPGSLFVALRGPRFDGHDFLEEARRAGAAGVVVRRGTAVPAGLAVFEVEDTLDALGRLAAARRALVKGPVVAITGSNGKTATRTLMEAALSAGWRVHATRDNQNNLVGVPLTILAMPEEAEALVVECGASLVGEIARMRDIVRPDIAVVTNVGAAHLEGFGDLAGVLREKVSLLEGVDFGVVGTRPPELVEEARRRASRVVTAGLEGPAEIRPESWRLGESGCVELVFRGQLFRLPLVGRHQGDNAMLVLAVCAELGLELAKVARALAGAVLPHGRCEVIRRGNLLVLHDAYNANPASLEAALETAAALRGSRRLVVLVGTMLELGQESDRLHREMAARVVASGADLIGAVGEFANALESWRAHLGDRLITAAGSEELGALVADRLQGDELVVLKASRGVALERALPGILARGEGGCSTTG